MDIAGQLTVRLLWMLLAFTPLVSSFYLDSTSLNFYLNAPGFMCSR